MNTLNFKSNANLMALRTSNNFGDQLIAIVDISKSGGPKDSNFPYVAGLIIKVINNSEGSHVEFNEKTLLGVI